MDKKIFWDEVNGNVYWLEDDGEVTFAPMNNDSTCNLADGGIVDVWTEGTEEESKAEEARIRSKLV